jgi:hypothetical protein
MGADPEVRIAGDRASVVEGREVLLDVSLADLVSAVAGLSDRAPSCGVLPDGVRMWYERGDATAVAIEVAPHSRTVRWLADDSREPFGRAARYESYFIAFPFVILLVVFRRGALTGLQQLYYKTTPLDRDEKLLLPNLYNVAKGYSQTCWVCLQHLRPLNRFGWRRKIDAVVDHVFTAAFNRSAEIHEGNSYWTTMRGIDPRVETLQAWSDATRENPLFPLEVPWKPAGTTARRELMGMLDRVARPREVRTAMDLAGIATRVSASKAGA